jgi:xylose isomerase
LIGPFDQSGCRVSLDGDGQLFESGKLSLADLRDLAANNPKPVLKSGKQELVENVINDYRFSS